MSARSLLALLFQVLLLLLLLLPPPLLPLPPRTVRHVEIATPASKKRTATLEPPSAPIGKARQVDVGRKGDDGGGGYSSSSLFPTAPSYPPLASVGSDNVTTNELKKRKRALYAW